MMHAVAVPAHMLQAATREQGPAELCTSIAELATQHQRRGELIDDLLKALEAAKHRERQAAASQRALARCGLSQAACQLLGLCLVHQRAHHGARVLAMKMPLSSCSHAGNARTQWRLRQSSS